MGKYSGGVAKTAVFSSALMGSISGSSVANTATTGAFTIPLMKKTGFNSEEAGAVEVAASTGGQILPPIMGAGAFIMAEFTATPYIQIVAVSILPALIYYISVFTAVHIMARKNGLRGLPEKDRPKLIPTLKEGFHLLLPLVVLVYLLVEGFTPYYAGFLCIIFLLIVTAFRSTTRFNIPMVIKSLELASARIIRISPAAACAGIILGVSTQTGVALKISSIILSASGGHLLLAIILVGVIAYLLGMGLPATSAYIIAAILASPALVKLGVPMLAAHLIVFWFAQTSGFTPPVCLCAYTAAAISGGDPMKTGVQSTKLALGILVIPFLFAYSPIIFTENTASPLAIATVFTTATAGMISLNIAIEGFLHSTAVASIERVALILAGIMLFIPQQISSLIGGAILLLFLARRFHSRKTAEKGERHV
jgi:TRAP transporter 4TM/12TM fusion protein